MLPPVWPEQRQHDIPVVSRAGNALTSMQIEATPDAPIRNINMPGDYLYLNYTSGSTGAKSILFPLRLPWPSTLSLLCLSLPLDLSLATRKWLFLEQPFSLFIHCCVCISPPSISMTCSSVMLRYLITQSPHGRPAEGHCSAP